MKPTKTILATAYAVNPFKGSEDGMGWNFINQIACHSNVIAITRKNNREHIDRYMQKNPKEYYQNIQFKYFDLPYYLRFWKKGSRGALLYFYLWQLFVPVFIIKSRLRFDIAHNLNFHNDWTPSFLWILGKPFVWGPVGHHPWIPNKYLKDEYPRQEIWKNNLTWCIKCFFWMADPFLKLTKWKASKVICMNSEAARQLRLPEKKIAIIPSVASKTIQTSRKITAKGNNFKVLFAGRFVALKGYDIVVKAFASFYHNLHSDDQENASLTLLGSGPGENHIWKLARKYRVDKKISIVSWVPYSEIHTIYADHDVFFFPSHEGAGMVVAEAMSHGLPVLCFNNSGPGEFVDEKSGIKIMYSHPDESVKAFSYHLSQLNKNRDLLNKLSVGAKSRFSEAFDWSVRGRQLEQIYQEIMSKQTVTIKDHKKNLELAIKA